MRTFSMSVHMAFTVCTPYIGINLITAAVELWVIDHGLGDFKVGWVLISHSPP